MKSNTFDNKGCDQMHRVYDRIIFNVKYNRKLLKDDIAERAEDIISEILDENQCELVGLNVQPNFVFIHFGYPPGKQLSKLVNRIKGKSSYLLRREFPALQEDCPKALWAVGYRIYHH